MTSIIVVNNYLHAAPAAFAPLTDITWGHSFWAEGPEFAALGVADTAVVATLPDETSTTDATEATNRPTYRATSNLNSQPGIRFNGTNNRLVATWGAAITLPFSIAFVAKLNAQTDGTTYVLSSGLVGATGRHDIMTNTTPNPDQWLAIASAVNMSGGDADTGGHLFVAEFAGGGASSFTVDGVVLASGVTSTHQSTGVAFGYYSPSNTFWSNMDMAFWGIKASAFTAPEKASLLAWSRGKYGTP